jgi:hypothetical protein
MRQQRVRIHIVALSESELRRINDVREMPGVTRALDVEIDISETICPGKVVGMRMPGFRRVTMEAIQELLGLVKGVAK